MKLFKLTSNELIDHDEAELEKLSKECEELQKDVSELSSGIHELISTKRALKRKPSEKLQLNFKLRCEQIISLIEKVMDKLKIDDKEIKEIKRQQSTKISPPVQLHCTFNGKKIAVLGLENKEINIGKGNYPGIQLSENETSILIGADIYFLVRFDNNINLKWNGKRFLATSYRSFNIVKNKRINQINPGQVYEIENGNSIYYESMGSKLFLTFIYP